MIAVGHTSVGVVLGVAASELISPDIAAPIQVVMVGLAGLGSHYLMDLIPHGHYNMNMKDPSRQETLKLLVDVALPILLVASYLLYVFGFGLETWLVGAGVTGAQMPDIAMGLRGRRLFPRWGWLNKEAQFHSSTHWHNPHEEHKATEQGGRKLGLSDLWQVAMICLALFLLLA